MPFSSQKQRAFMYARHPDIAKRWRAESGPQRGLPERSPSAKPRTKRKADDRRQHLIEQFLKKRGGRGR